jgi:hypothetical protein
MVRSHAVFVCLGGGQTPSPQTQFAISRLGGLLKSPEIVGLGGLCGPRAPGGTAFPNVGSETPHLLQGFPGDLGPRRPPQSMISGLLSKPPNLEIAGWVCGDGVWLSSSIAGVMALCEAARPQNVFALSC